MPLHSSLVTRGKLHLKKIKEKENSMCLINLHGIELSRRKRWGKHINYIRRYIHKETARAPAWGVRCLGSLGGEHRAPRDTLRNWELMDCTSSKWLEWNTVKLGPSSGPGRSHHHPPHDRSAWPRPQPQLLGISQHPPAPPPRLLSQRE